MEDKLRILEGRPVVLSLKDGSKLPTLIKKAFIHLGKIEVLKRGVLTKTILEPELKDELLDDPINYSLIPLNNIIEVKEINI